MERHMKTKAIDTSGGPSPKRRKLGRRSRKEMKRQASRNEHASPPRKKVRFPDSFYDSDDDDVLILNIDLETVLELEHMLSTLEI
jgi:hypothetical protein